MATLTIKDGNGDLKELKVYEDIDGVITPLHQIEGEVTVSYGVGEKLQGIVEAVIVTSSFQHPLVVTSSAGMPITITGSTRVINFPSSQVVTASFSNPVTVTGNVSVNNFPDDIGRSTSQINILGSSLSWNTEASGTFQLLPIDLSRKEILIYNSGPGNLYVKVSSTTNTSSNKFGFILSNTASAPTNYSFVVYPSGTYSSVAASKNLFHAGYVVNNASKPEMITAVSTS